ncbi:hypothetical protein BWI93_17850 [Siphonobacter sp. BAB-5385]|uniref:hypothetical protein n=1 Tax=Siphonobacter sp. BAB-5385 TaxID=1864822 RepID=UPI000B9EACDB|nr:hypothetical protein [Siphonobacter sp. BAB-5385]OZI06861.1 hypothetical protein BWI93_17850 [Siphonobacter sp. BAB-5385]
MKFLIIGDIQAEDSLTFDVADYLWNKGNEIYLQSLDADRSDAETPGLEISDAVVIVQPALATVSSAYSSLTPDLLEGNDNLASRTEDRLSIRQLLRQQKLVFLFSQDGIFSNLRSDVSRIHKIFTYPALNQTALLQFFAWCKTLGLFA